MNIDTHAGARKLIFPRERSLGYLWDAPRALLDQPIIGTAGRPAQGELAVPAGHAVRLGLRRLNAATLPYLAQLRADDQVFIEGIGAVRSSQRAALARVAAECRVSLMSRKLDERRLTVLPLLPNVTALRILGLGAAGALTDWSAPVIASLPRLRELTITESQISDQGLDQIIRSTLHLEHLTIGAAITDRSAERLSQLAALQSLELRDCAITDSTLDHISALTNLTTLSLLRCQVGDPGMRALTSLTKVEHLSIVAARVTDASAAALAPMAELQRLFLEGVPIGGGYVHIIATLAKLTMVCLDRTYLADQDLAPLSKLPQLRLLDLSLNNLTDAAVPALARMQTLTDLMIRGTRITDEGVGRLQAALPGCLIDTYLNENVEWLAQLAI